MLLTSCIYGLFLFKPVFGFAFSFIHVSPRYWYALFFKMAFSYRKRGQALDISEVRSRGVSTASLDDKQHAS